jgi:hypothetical protein
MQRAIPVHYASGLLLVHRRFEKSSALQLAQLFFDRLYIHHLSIAGFNTVGDLDHFSNTLPKNDLKVNKVDSVFWLQKSSILSSPFPSLRGDRVASPFMVRQTHHERTINIKYQLVSRSPFDTLRANGGLRHSLEGESLPAGRQGRGEGKISNIVRRGLQFFHF